MTFLFFFFLFVAQRTTNAVSNEYLTNGFRSLFGDEIAPVTEGGSELTDMFEGDMRLGDKNLEYYLHSFPVSDLGDIQSNALADTRFRWQYRTVPYTISTNDAETVSAINQAIERFHDNTCLRFIRRSSQRDYVNFKKGAGCWSYVGRRGGKQDLSIGSGCESVGIVQHEIMHALGFFHEQSRTDRDNYVTIRWKNIMSGTEDNFQKYSADRITDLGFSYDYRSIMHYRAKAFSKNGLVTIDPNGNKIGQRNGFSGKDIQKINKMYQCSDNSDDSEEEEVSEESEETGGGGNRSWRVTWSRKGNGKWKSTCSDIWPIRCERNKQQCATNKELQQSCKSTCRQYVPSCQGIRTGSGTSFNRFGDSDGGGQ